MKLCAGYRPRIRGRYMSFLDILKSILFGIVEGVTEFLPISSTGHLILLEDLIHMDQPAEFFNVYKVVIQLGAILAVVVLYWDRLWPFGRGKSASAKRAIWQLWGKVVIACIPAVIIGYFLDDIVDAKLSTPYVVAAMLIVYGIAFIVVEKICQGKEFRIKKLSSLDNRTALFIGMFQVLALIPGTSRSGATILGAMLLGVGRTAAAEFSFFLGIPIVFGAGGLKTLKYFLAGNSFSVDQWLILVSGTIVSFLVAFVAIRTFIGYIKKHSFTAFGIYRIVLGVVVLIYFALK